MGWVALCCALLATSALAQTTVSGAIPVDTRWSLANAPYVVSGDVVVQDGAMLTIDAGVTVYMGSNASLTVQAGGLKALGTAANPIQVLSDKSRLGQVAAPGDWNQWLFSSGTINTRLDYVIFENGSGLDVKGSAPVFNYLNLRNHQGAAIAIDLAASPSGVGNQASGNLVNGIAVPAGTINGSVKWDLRGIPYVVASGVVSVGVSPTVNSITPYVIQQGASLTVNISGNRLIGLTDASFDNAGLSAQILPGATDSQASMSVIANPSAATGNAALRLMTDAGAVQVANAMTVNESQSLTLSLPAGILVAPGLSLTVPVSLNGPAPAGGVLVMLDSDQSTVATVVPASVTVQANQTSANFSLTGHTAGTATINARATGYQSATLPVTVDVATIQVGNPAVSSISTGVEEPQTFAITLSRSAPPGGVNVMLAISEISTATVTPSMAFIPEGQSTATLQASVTGVVKGYTTLTANAQGLDAVSVPVTVNSKPDLSFTLTEKTLGKGFKTQAQPSESGNLGVFRRKDGFCYTPNEALTVNLVSSNNTKVQAPTSVTIPAGHCFALFDLAGEALTDSNTSVTIDSAANGYSSPAIKLAINVVNPVPVFENLDNYRSTKSARDSFTVALAVAGGIDSKQVPTGDMQIKLSTVDLNGMPSTSIVPGIFASTSSSEAVANVTLSANQTPRANYYLGTPSNLGNYMVKAEIVGGSSAVSAIQTVSTAELIFSSGPAYVGKGMKADLYDAYVSRTTNGVADVGGGGFGRYAQQFGPNEGNCSSFRHDSGG